jgi:hypothetical protein
MLKALLQFVDFMLKAAAAYAATPEGSQEFAEVVDALGLMGEEQPQPVPPNVYRMAGQPLTKAQARAQASKR